MTPDLWSQRLGVIFLFTASAERASSGGRVPRGTRPGVADPPIVTLSRRRSAISRFAPFLWISLGAILGANARYVVNRVMAQWLGTGFPYGTFVVNTVGCLLVGIVATLVTGRLIDRPEVVRLVLIVGFLGSLTTFSSFAYETHGLFHDGAWARAVANILVSLFAGLAGVRLGILLTPRLGGLL